MVALLVCFLSSGCVNPTQPVSILLAHRVAIVDGAPVTFLRADLTVGGRVLTIDNRADTVFRGGFE